MKSFSERNNLDPIKKFQQGKFSKQTRNLLWNIFSKYVVSGLPKSKIYFKFSHHVFELLFQVYLKEYIDKYDSRVNFFTNKLLSWFLEEPWKKVCNLIEWGYFALNHEYYPKSVPYVLNNIKEIQATYKFRINLTLARELASVRIVNDKVIPITEKEEILEIESAISQSSSIPNVKNHLIKSLEKLAEEPKADFRNSIKESISAVEGICRLILGTKDTLGRALEEIYKKNMIHKNLKVAFKNLYWYTSDTEGIRHALMKVPNLDYEDARFMLVCCSTFVNYLIVKADKSNISLKIK